jgi:hypothetical protein
MPYISAWNRSGPTGGSLVNQISTYRPRAGLDVRKVCVPPTSSALATVVKLPRVEAARVSLPPSSTATSAPGSAPKVTVTYLSLTRLPMSRISPLPVFSPPNTGLPR